MNNGIVKIENNNIVVAEEVIQQIKDFTKIKEELDLKEKELKQDLKEAMEELGLKKFIVNGLCATIKEATIRKSLDTTRIKEEMPDIYEEYLKETPVSSSITLTIAD